MHFNLHFSPEISADQKTATIRAAEILGGYLTDDITLDLYFTSTDKLDTNVSGAAFPSFIGGVDYDNPDYTNNREAGNFITFGEYHDALVADSSGFGRDVAALNHLEDEIMVRSTAYGKTVFYHDNFNQRNYVRGLELTTANAKAVGLDRDKGNVDGVIAYNSLDRYGSDLDKPVVSEYRTIQEYSDSEFEGNLAFINVSDFDRLGKKLVGKFTLMNAQITDLDGDGQLDTSGDLKIVSVQEYSDRTTYRYESYDSNFWSNEKNQISFNAEKINPDAAAEVRYAAVHSFQEPGVAVAQRPYSDTNPYEQSIDSLTDLAIHEIGHVLGIVSVVDEIPEKYGDRFLDEADVELTHEEKSFRYAQSHDLTPFDLFRHQETDNGEVRRSLNPNLNNTGSFFTHDKGTETRVKLAEGKHISREYLVDIYELDEGAIANPYLDHFLDNDFYQGSHFRNDGVLAPVHGNDGIYHLGLEGVDRTALDVIGYDIRNAGDYQHSTVTVFDEVDEVVLPDLERALYRLRTSSTTSRRGTNYTAENGTEAEEILGSENVDLAANILDSFI